MSTGRPCKTCKGTGELEINGTRFTCPPCFGTGEEPGTLVTEERKKMRERSPAICTVCRRTYPGPINWVGGLSVCHDPECIEKAGDI